MINLGILASSINKPTGPSPNAWDIAHLGSAVDSFDTGNSDNNGIFFKPDGLKMYISRYGSFVYEYDLSVAWDVSTAVLLQNNGFALWRQGISIRESDGLKMYLVIANVFEEYDMSPGWDLSTLSLNDTFSVPADMNGVYMKQDGTTAYMCNSTTEDIYEYDLSTPWDVTTASLTYNVDISGIMTDAQDIFFKPDGTRMFVTKIGFIEQWDLSVAWDLSTAVHDSGASSTQGGNGGFWKPDGLVTFASLAGATNSVLSYEIT